MGDVIATSPIFVLFISQKSKTKKAMCFTTDDFPLPLGRICINNKYQII